VNSEPLMSQDPLADAVRFYELLARDGGVREIRIPKYNKYNATAAGWFDSAESAVSAIRPWDGRANIFLTLNPVDPALRARANGHLYDGIQSTTSDTDVLRRRWLLIDIDPKRPSGISSTDAELGAARDVLDAVTAFLSGKGWPEPILIMSGNGHYALYPLDLPNDSETLGLCHGALVRLAASFDTSTAHIDTTVANAARIVGFVGTMKVKGEEVEDRKHRRSRILRAPSGEFGVVTPQQLETVAVVATPPTVANRQQAPRLAVLRGNRTLRQTLDEAGIVYKAQPVDAQGITWYHVAQCPFHDDGRPFECGVGQRLPDGPFCGKCFHREGDGLGWQAWKQALGLDTRRSSGRAALGQPVIEVAERAMNEVVADAWDAVGMGNEPAVMFRHGGAIAEVRDAGERLVIKHLEPPELRGRLDRLATWQRTGRFGPSPVIPPKPVLEDMLAFPESLPVLKAITGRPVLLGDGTLDVTPGYQRESKLFYEPIGEPLPDVPEVPTPEDVARAVSLLRDDWLVDFPFVDESSRTHTVAMPLTAYARELFGGPSPLFPIDAPGSGTGKGFLAQSVGIIVSGRDPAVTTLPRDDDEMRKRITSLLREGAQVILLDNVKRKLNSAELASALTSAVWGDRLLSTNTTGQYPNLSLWLTTGNNLQLDGEVARRSVWIRLDAKMDRPWERKDFKHDPFIAWVHGNRHELAWALLVLCRHWIASGRPRFKTAAIGSFEEWAEVVGGILELAGYTGFLGNRDEMYERVDAESEEWRTFTLVWWEDFGSDPQGVAGLFVVARDRELLPSIFAGSTDNASERSLKTKLGRALKRQLDRRFGDLTIKAFGKDGHTSAAQYVLHRAEPSRPTERGSAEVQHESGACSASNAEPAEPAEPVSDPNARSDRSSVSTSEASPTAESGAVEVQQVQQVQQSGSNPTLFDAEPSAEPTSPSGVSSTEVTQGTFGVAKTCAECGQRPTIDGRRCFRCEATP
jgi:hypothetical protein